MFATFKRPSTHPNDPGREVRIVANKVTGLVDKTAKDSKPACAVYCMSDDEPFMIQGTCRQVEDALMEAMTQEYAIRKAIGS